MTSEEARALIRKHSIRDADPDLGTWSDSFIGSLRPFVGLSEATFHELMAALRVVAPSLRAGLVDRELMSDLWFICWQAYLIGLDITGALQRNKVLSKEDTDNLADWMFQIGSAVFDLLEAQDVTIAFAGYDNQYGSQLGFE
jgi:hypothetical protein